MFVDASRWATLPAVRFNVLKPAVAPTPPAMVPQFQFAASFHNPPEVVIVDVPLAASDSSAAERSAKARSRQASGPGNLRVMLNTTTVLIRCVLKVLFLFRVLVD